MVHPQAGRSDPARPAACDGLCARFDREWQSLPSPGGARRVHATAAGRVAKASFGAKDVVGVLSDVFEKYGRPDEIRSDNGTEGTPQATEA